MLCFLTDLDGNAKMHYSFWGRNVIRKKCPEIAIRWSGFPEICIAWLMAWVLMKKNVKSLQRFVTIGWLNEDTPFKIYLGNLLIKTKKTDMRNKMDMHCGYWGTNDACNGSSAKYVFSQIGIPLDLRNERTSIILYIASMTSWVWRKIQNS